MTPQERRAALGSIIRRHTEVANELRETGLELRLTQRNAHAAIIASEQAFEHIKAVSDAILAANLSVLALLDADGGLPDDETE